MNEPAAFIRQDLNDKEENQSRNDYAIKVRDSVGDNRNYPSSWVEKRFQEEPNRTGS